MASPGGHQLSEFDHIPPLASLPAAEWAEVVKATKGIFSDIDDTLTHERTLVPEASLALVRATRAGLRVVLVTGRPIGWAEVLAQIFPVDAAIAENGAVAAIPLGGRYYYEDAAQRAAGARRREAALALAQKEVPEAQLSADHALREIDLAFDINERTVLPEPAIAKLTAVLEGAGLHTTRSSIHLHGTFSTSDKGKMSARIAEHLWQESSADVRARYLYVGDSPNDAPAFAFFPRSVGVRNVLESVDRLRSLGALPWAVTRGHGGYGFAELVDFLLANR